MTAETLAPFDPPDLQSRCDFFFIVFGLMNFTTQLSVIPTQEGPYPNYQLSTLNSQLI